MNNTILYIFYIIIFIINHLFIINVVFCQELNIDSLENKNFEIKVDSINKEMRKKLVLERVRESGLDSIVFYKASENIIYNVKDRKMILNKEANVKFKNQSITAYQIVFSFEESTMNAFVGKDTNNKFIGIPKFIDKNEEYYGKDIKFNFKTGKGVINLAETELSGGFYFGEKIKRIDDKIIYVEDGYYTTCDHPEPHYHFSSHKMKIISDDRVLLDPLIFYIEDLPLLIVPFGIFFPSTSGRQSGIIIPSYAFSRNRGVVFQNLGFYWAASDYWDTQLKADLYSKGGFMLKTNTRWNLLNKFNGSFDLDYGYTRNTVDEDYTTNWRFLLSHSHEITPYDKVVLNLNFSSQNFNRNTLTSNQDFIRQSIRSSASYSTQFSNRTSFSINYEREQNIVNDEYTQYAATRYNIPSFQILKNYQFLPNWMKEITFNYNINANYRNTKTEKLIINKNQIDTTKIDTSKVFIYDHSQRIEHLPSLNISPKLGYFNISPFISFNFNNYFRKINKIYNPLDSTVKNDTTWGFYTDYTYGAGLSISTYLYGIISENKPLLGLINPNKFGFKAFRHTYNPSIGWSFRPDQKTNNNLIGNYYDERIQSYVYYSRFEADGGGLASRYFSSSLNYSDLHSFEIKIAQGDTLPDVNIELLKINTSTSYDFAKDSLNLSNLNVQFRSPALKFIDFNGSASFKFYDEIVKEVVNPNTGNISYQYITTNDFLISKGKGLFRLTNLTLNFGATFNSSGLQTTQSNEKDTSKSKNEKIEYGERFSKRYYGTSQENDIFGDSSPGYTSFYFPWSIRLNLYYSLNKFSIDPKSHSERIDLSVNGSIRLTEKWNLTFNGGYDFVNQTLTMPSINLSRDLHCWEFIFNWIPSGGNSGFYLRIGIKSNQLKDLKYEKQSNPLLR